MAAKTVDVVIHHNSMQFSDTNPQHEHDAEAVFDLAVDKDAWAVTGTESGLAPDNHDLHQYLTHYAQQADFYIFAHKWGEWVALNKRYLHHFEHNFMGPFIEGTHGVNPAHGSHAPRGITLVTARAVDDNLGQLTFGVAHFLTDRSESVSGSNMPLIRGVEQYGRAYGQGSDVCFFNADANENDAKQDVFKGGPFTTIADELGKHPATHGVNKKKGNPIDIIASYNPDKRVHGEEYFVFDDSNVKLFSDHFICRGVYSVRKLIR